MLHIGRGVLLDIRYWSRTIIRYYILDTGGGLLLDIGRGLLLMVNYMLKMYLHKYIYIMR
jgi:hypothetical protein